MERRACLKTTAWVLLTVGLTLSGACSGMRRDTFDEQQAAQGAIIEELASDYGAVMGWDTALGDDFLAQPLTIDLQEQLVDPGRPIVFPGRLADVRRTPYGVVALFSPSTPAYFGPNVFFRLSVPPDLLGPLRGAPRDSFFDNLAVVAEIHDVRRPDVTLKSWAWGEEGYNGSSELIVEIDPEPAGFFVVDGKLLAFRQFRRP